MNCPNCGAQNPAGAAICYSCGKELRSSGSRNCVSCGRAIPWEANVCPYCGKDYRVQASSPQAQPTISAGMRALFYILSFLIPLAGIIIGAIYYSKPDRESKQVGKICLVLGVVSILLIVGIGAVVYLAVLGFGGTDGFTPAIIVVSKTRIPDGIQMTLGDPTEPVTWSDVTVELSDGPETVVWHPRSQDLDSMSPEVFSYGALYLGSLLVTLNVTDLMGNGSIDIGDRMTFSTSGGSFLSATTYTMTLVYEPTGGSMTANSFVG